MPQYCTKTVLTIPNGVLYTTTQTGAAINLAVSHDVHADAHTGYLREAQVIVEQTAGGGGNNAGNRFNFTVQTSRTPDPNGTWINLKMGTAIEIITNDKSSFSSTVQGPLSGYIRVIATETGTAEAYFAVYVIAGG
jgi:hypothetical protein